MLRLVKLKERLSQSRKGRPSKGQEEGSNVPASSASTTTDPTCASTLITPAGPINHSRTSIITLSNPPQSTSPFPSSSSSRLASTQPAASGASPTNQAADSWTRAYEIFREHDPELMEDYKEHLLGDTVPSADFPSQQSVETVLKRFLEEREKAQWNIRITSHGVNVRAQVDRLVKFFQWSDQFVKDAVSTQPYAALAWSAASLLLPLLASSTTQNESMLTGLNSIGVLQIYWKACEETYFQPEHRQQYERLVEPLAKLYSRILEYQALMIHHLSKPQRSRAWRNLVNSDTWDSKWQEIDKLDKQCRELIDPLLRGEIRQSGNVLLREMQMSSKIQADMLQTLKEDKQDEKEARLLQDLATAAGDYKRSKDLNPGRVHGTCEWFLTDETFCKWRDSELPSLLWVSAGPGRGKSVLSKSLFDEELLIETVTTLTTTAAAKRKTTVCYFFFKDGGEGHMDGAQALCAVLHQLFTHPSTSELIQCSLKSYRDHGATLFRKFSELWHILLECAKSSDAGEIVCILDALDECKEDARQELIRTLKEFYSRREQLLAPSSKLKFIVTSRPYPDLETSFKRFPASAAYLHFDGDDKSEYIRREINLVIDAMVPDITVGFSADDQQQISEHLKSMEHRTYLWLHLTFDIIEKSPTDYGRWPDIDKLLHDVPPDVSSAYTKILSRSTNRPRAEILLQIMLAAARPLTLDEANVALALAVQSGRLKSHKEVESAMWPKSKFPSIVMNLCGLFVSVYDSKLSFIHQTAREFLTHSSPNGNWEGRFVMPRSHSTILGSCIQYLMLADIDLRRYGDRAEDRRYPYIAYATAYWPLHFVSQEATDAALYRSDARTLCDMSRRQASIWVPGHLRRIYLNCSGWTDLALASYLGLSEVVDDMLLTENADVNLRGGDYGTALVAASAASYPEISYRKITGHRYTAIVKSLLEQGADIEAKDEIGWTPLSCAIDNGHEAIVWLLLEKGADMEVKEKSCGRTPLSIAAGDGNEAIVKLLLEKGADVEVKDKSYGRTPLSWAATFGREAIVKLLLEKGADIEAKEENFDRTPLSLAAEYGHEATIKLLLEKGADIEAKEETFDQTPLSLAAEYGHEAIIKLLLEKGADIEAKDNKGQMPLSWATKYGHEAALKLLLEKGADIEVKDKDGRTPLSIAAEYGHEAIVKLLLEKGAKMEAKKNIE